jgi:hypothetical protein
MQLPFVLRFVANARPLPVELFHEILTDFNYTGRKERETNNKDSRKKASNKCAHKERGSEATLRREYKRKREPL